MSSLEPERPELGPDEADALAGMGEAADQLLRLGELTNRHVPLLVETLELEERARETQKRIAEAQAGQAPEPEPAEDPAAARERAEAEHHQRRQEGWAIQRFLRALPMAGHRYSDPEKTGLYDPLEFVLRRSNLVAARILETEVWWAEFASVPGIPPQQYRRLDQPSRPIAWDADLLHNRPGHSLKERALPTFIVGQQITPNDPVVKGDAVTLLLAPAFPMQRSTPVHPDILLKVKASLAWFGEAESMGMEYFLDPIEDEEELSRYPQNNDGEIELGTPPAGNLQHVLSVGLPDSLPPPAPRALRSRGKQKKRDQVRASIGANGLTVAPVGKIPYHELDARTVRDFNMGHHAMRLAVVLERSGGYRGLVDTYRETIAPLARNLSE